MNLALLLAAAAIAIGWAGGAWHLNHHYYRDVRDLRDNLRKSHPNDDWENLTQAERRTAQPFNAIGEAIFHETRAGLRLHRARAQAILAALGLCAILALVVMARSSVMA